MTGVRPSFGLTLGIASAIILCWSSTGHTLEASPANGSQIDWLNAGVGMSTFGTSRGVSFSYPEGKSLISIRYVYNSSEFAPYSGLLQRHGLNETVWDAGVLYGRRAKASYGLASVSGGIGMVGGVRGQKFLRRNYSGSIPVEYPERRFITVGIPVAGQLFWTPLSNLGIGIYGFANLNPEESFAGALLGVQLGNLK